AGRGNGGQGAPGEGNLTAGNVVPPPPTLGAGSGPAGGGRGLKGNGSGGSLDSGSVLAPPGGGGGNGKDSGVVISNDAGTKVGLPGSKSGSLAMSPGGGDKPGLGGSGGGTGIGHGKDTGSGMTGEGPGAGKSGAGRGSDPHPNGGISPSAGPGGAGNAPSGTPAVPGVSVSGGSVTLPSFGPGGGSDPNAPGRSSVKQQQGPAITIVATSRSGGAFNFYGVLKGDRVYTVYLDTALGTAVMQFADPASEEHPYGEDLTGPQPLRSSLPAGLPRARLVIACILDTNGNLKNLKVLEPGPAGMTSSVLAALPGWKFRPALRNQQPVEVNAILGFGIDTNDRN
ncbi:MAG TPA: energy transducer TonB, partial [Candidatus Solibacter sp.]|nr:energy transducer TonB [Candidatus Solibacter sp.]